MHEFSQDCLDMKRIKNEFWTLVRKLADAVLHIASFTHHYASTPHRGLMSFSVSEILVIPAYPHKCIIRTVISFNKVI